VSSWRSLAYAAARPLLFRFDSERIHRLTLDALRVAGESRAGRGILAVAGGAPRRPAPWAELMGLRFRNRVGMAAGWDKDCVALRGWEALGFGFAEVGTVTPEAQPGTPRPRLFRLAPDRALVNRMGFNNAGAASLARRIMLARRHLPSGFVVGANIGLGRDTPSEAAAQDYRAAARLVLPVADYLVVNVSSPNTPGLRELQDPARLADLVAVLIDAGAAADARRPVLVKLSPDLDDAALAALLPPLLEAGASGFILSNTSTRRDGLRSPHAVEEGGLSGAPLLQGTLDRVRHARRLVGQEPVIVASGGLSSAADVAAAFDAGADLVQLWTGLVYSGPGLVGEAVRVPPRQGSDW
jgi:dihydroorotate dehydrogenase